MNSSPIPVLLDDTDPALAETDEIPEASVVSGSPGAKVWQAPEIPGARNVSYGSWVGQPGSMRSEAYPYDEVFVLIDGLVRLDSENGSSLVVRPGQTCFMPEGWRGVWNTLVPTRKTYFIAA